MSAQDFMNALKADYIVSSDDETFDPLAYSIIYISDRNVFVQTFNQSGCNGCFFACDDLFCRNDNCPDWICTGRIFKEVK